MRYLILKLSLDNEKFNYQCFISFKGSNETCNMHTKSNNIEIRVGSETDEIIEEFLNLFCKDIKKDWKNQ